MQYHESVLHNYFIHQPIYIFVRLHQELCGIYLLLLGRDICFNKDHKPADKLITENTNHYITPPKVTNKTILRTTSIELNYPSQLTSYALHPSPVPFL